MDSDLSSNSVVIIVAIIAVLAAIVILLRVRSVFYRRWDALQMPQPDLPIQPPPELAADAQLRELLARGNKIEAIKRARELTGMGLKEAKDLVERLPLATMPAAAPSDPVGAPRPAAPPAPVSAPRPAFDPAADPRVREMIARGNTIDAIKRVRQMTGMGLKEAKDVVDRLARSAPRVAPPAPSAPVSAPRPATDLTADPELREQLERGSKIGAIRRVRELTGMGLQEARDFVESTLEHSARTPALGGGPAVVLEPQADPAADPRVRELLARGNKIEAIKRVRELTGMGLKEAKDFVESL